MNPGHRNNPEDPGSDHGIADGKLDYSTPCALLYAFDCPKGIPPQDPFGSSEKGDIYA